MNILFFATTDFYRRPNPSFHLMCSMISDILEAGHSVYFLGIEEEGLERHIPVEFENNSNFHSSLVKLPQVKKSAFIKRYLIGLKYAWKSRKFLKELMGKCDVVFARSSPTVFLNLVFSKKYAKQQKVILNIQDMFPGASIASGVMPKRWMQRVFFLVQKIAYKKADVIVAISEDMRRRLLEEKVPDDKIRVIVNWFDDRTVHEVPRDNNRFIKKYNMQKDKFYVQYAGTLGYVFDYKMVLNVAQRLKSNEDIIIQIIGDGSQKEAFINEANNLGLTNIKFHPLEPQEMVADVYSACDVCLIPLKDKVIGNAVPSKAGLLMACKRAIIISVDPGCDFADMVNNERIGIAVSNQNPQEVADAVIRMYNNREECVQMGLRGYDYGHVLFSRTLNMQKYLDLFAELSNKQ